MWTGQPVGGGNNPGVPAGTHEVPMLFGGMAPASFTRMAKWGQGDIAGSLPAQFVADHFEQARAAWKDSGRAGQPHPVALAYFALGDPDQGRANVGDYYAGAGEFTDLVMSGVCGTPEMLKSTITSFADLGLDELIFNPGTDDVDDIKRLADAVL
ncbi:hypothetical protein AB0F91_28670 [Amycolatopsis sp. NPDC023774]|uniref:hypothetical protein n=1 Tax=Amycolatopsis sp. NPDC023774 TaxID=3155015 RepID=UPI003409D545